MPFKKKPELERFWPKVNKNGKLIMADPCWEWLGSQNGQGYGQFRCGEDGKRRYAHRFSYEIHKGPIPTGMDLLHACDNPPCVNPWHLSPGTDLDNRRDSVRKGRWQGPKGKRMSKETIMQMMDYLNSGMKVGDVAKLFGVCGRTMTRINNLRKQTAIAAA